MLVGENDEIVACNIQYGVFAAKEIL